jgi:GDPmannose 4,6-dehydratase
MRSTGEVMGLDVNFGRAFAKSQIGAGTRLPIAGAVFISVRDADKDLVTAPARALVEMGFSLVATSGTARVLEALKKHAPKATIHVCASSEVFGRVSKEKLPIDEECSFHPASPYAISKVGTDLIGRHYAEAYGMTVMTTRMFTHTGPRRGDVFAESTFAKQIAMIEKGLIEPVVKVGNLASLRTIADVRDAVRAYYMLVTVKPISGAYYNLGGTYSCTIEQVLNTLLSYSSRGNEIRIEVDPDRLRPIDADLQVPNTSKFKAHTGWEPVIPYEQTMHDLLDYWREQVAGNPQGFLTR